MASQTCPRCNKACSKLIKIETGMRLGLKEADKLEGIPDSVCANCYAGLSRYVSQGARLRAERKAKEANRLDLWSTRVDMVKQGHRLMAQKSFTDAAMMYEKYLRILEVVFDCGPDGLRPEIFQDSSKKKELTILLSVLWDLMRIYDMHARYNERQKLVVQQLVAFKSNSPVYRDILRKAAAFAPKAKNSENFKLLLRGSNIKSSRCFIATSAFDSPLAIEVQTLCRFRDQVLKKSHLGRQFTKFYYRHSPGVATWLDAHPLCKAPVRSALRAAAFLSSWTLDLISTHDQ